MRYKKGLSTVVTTLIIVLLVLAAIGIIWGPIRNLLSSSVSSLSSTKCLDLEFTATNLVNVTDSTHYNLTLKRATTGTDLSEVSAKVIFYNTTTNAASETIDFRTYAGWFNVGDVKTASNVDVGIVGVDKVEMIPYFNDPDSGEEVVCQTTSTRDF